MAAIRFRRLFYCWAAMICCMVGCHLVIAQPLPDRHPLTGRIMREDGKPIKGAQIVLRKQDELLASAFWGALTVSDADGMFSFPDAEEGSYFITVEAGGYAPEQNRPVLLDESAAPVKITLSKLVPFALRMLKPDGTPLVKAKVVVRLRGTGARGQRFPSGQTDDAGLFSFTAGDGARTPLIPGPYSVGVVAQGVGYANIDTLDVQPPAGKPEGTVLVYDVHLQAGGTLRAVARAVDDKGAPRFLGGASLSLGPLLESDQASRAAGEIGRMEDIASQTWYANYNDGAPLITRDGDGTVELTDLPVGRYSVRLILPGQPPLSRQEVEITANGTATLNFDFTLPAAAATLQVTVQDKQGAPLSNTEVELNLRSTGGGAIPGAPALPPDIVQDPAISIPGVLFRRGRTDQAGHLSLFPVPPGNWTVSALGADPARPGHHRLLSEAQPVTITAEGGTLTIIANPDKS